MSEATYVRVTLLEHPTPLEGFEKYSHALAAVEFTPGLGIEAAVAILRSAAAALERDHEEGRNDEGISD